MPIQPELEIRFTTSQNNYGSQSSPSNSIGGYIASNEVYPNGHLNKWVNNTQDYIPISPEEIPTTTGLASIGPEIIQYGDIDISNNNLIDVSRDINNLVSSPAGKNEYGVFERAFYLSPNPNTNLNRLFDTAVDKSLVQYRCVAVIHTGPSSLPIKNVRVTVLQSPSHPIQFDIGIEVPRHDSFTGSQEGSDSTTTVVDHSFDSYADDYFNGDIIYDPLSGTGAVITDFSGGVFTLGSNSLVIENGLNFVILPSASQAVNSHRDSPDSNNGLFYGFIGDGASSLVTFSDHNDTMQQYDLFYIWLKETVSSDTKKGDDLAANLMISFDDSYIPIQGKILSSGSPLEGTEVNANGYDASFYSSISDENGEYIFLLPSGWEGDINVITGLFSIPPSRTYMNLITPKFDQDFILEQIYTISGTVISLTLEHNINVVATGSCLGYPVNASYFMLVAGSYSIELPKGWNGYITLEGQWKYVYPASGRIEITNLSSDMTGQDFSVLYFIGNSPDPTLGDGDIGPFIGRGGTARNIGDPNDPPPEQQPPIPVPDQVPPPFTIPSPPKSLKRQPIIIGKPPNKSSGTGLSE